MDSDSSAMAVDEQPDRETRLTAWLRDNPLGQAVTPLYNSFLATGASDYFVAFCDNFLQSSSDLREIVLGSATIAYNFQVVCSADKSLSQTLLSAFTPAEPDPGTQQPFPVTIDQQRMAAIIEESWNQEFAGEAAEGLWKYLAGYLKLKDPASYANYLVMFQSSGCGKSRAVDEMSKRHFVIPICLRADGSSGYPPPDVNLRTYLNLVLTQSEVRANMVAFFVALFEEIVSVLAGDEWNHLSYVDTASHFRHRMTDEMAMNTHNNFRKGLYGKVVQRAKEWIAHKAIPVGSHQTPHRGSPPRTSPQGDSAQTPHHDAPPTTQPKVKPLTARELEVEHATRVAKACSTLVQILRKREGYSSKSHSPAIVLAFDEAHELTEKSSPYWSNFGELRSVLREMSSQSVFSIFMSTTGKLSQFVPSIMRDASARITSQSLQLIPPYCDFGLDLLTRGQPEKQICLSPEWTLERVTEDGFMTQLGRPLFGLQYNLGDETVRNKLLYFTAQKLLHHLDNLPAPAAVTEEQSLACLAFRLPIEFVSTMTQFREKEVSQVEGHLRICLKASPSNASMVTVSASEPYLSEAAYYAISTLNIDIVRTFQRLASDFCISTGDRGEFLVLLLLTLARDETVGRAQHPDRDNVTCQVGHPQSRILPLTKFLIQHLFYITDSTRTQFKALEGDFPSACFHFNHYVRLHEQMVISRDRLLLLMGRGAAVLCAPNQSAVDVIHPFLIGEGDGQSLVSSNFGAMLIQIKNDAEFGDTMDPKLFTDMDPFRLGILEPGDKHVPLIRIVFALASPRRNITVIRHEPNEEYGTVIYDIWVAGLTHTVLRPVKNPESMDQWNAILQASYGWRMIYADNTPVFNHDGTRKEISQPNLIRLSAHPGSTHNRASWENWSHDPPNQSLEAQRERERE